MSSTTPPSVTVIGAGNIGSAVAQIALKAGAAVQVLTRDATQAAAIGGGSAPGMIGDTITGDVVVLALPYAAFDEVLSAYPATALEGKVVVDPSNPIDFGTLDSLIDPPGSSATAQLAARLAGANVIKAFNTNFAATLASGVNGGAPTTVMVAGDDEGSKAKLAAVLTGAGLRAVDAGSLKRAHELEAMGALQIGLAITQQSGGLAILD